MAKNKSNEPLLICWMDSLVQYVGFSSSVNIAKDMKFGARISVKADSIFKLKWRGLTLCRCLGLPRLERGGRLNLPVSSSAFSTSQSMSSVPFTKHAKPPMLNKRLFILLVFSISLGPALISEIERNWEITPCQTNRGRQTPIELKAARPGILHSCFR